MAAIDLGTNSFHLVVARPTGNNRFEILARDKEVVRLGSGSGDMKELQPDAIERGVAALGRFRRIADTFGAEVHAVATSAVREAENREDFLEAALAKANVGVEVISGVEEARLIHLGVLQAVPANFEGVDRVAAGVDTDQQVVRAVKDQRPLRRQGVSHGAFDAAATTTGVVLRVQSERSIACALICPYLVIRGVIGLDEDHLIGPTALLILASAYRASRARYQQNNEKNAIRKTVH